MNPQRPRTGFRVLLLMLVMTPVLLWSMSSSALYRAGSPEPAPENKVALPLAPAVPMPPPKADLDQVRNGTFAAPIDPPDWVNGNAGASNAHYFEGQSIPYRMRLTNIALTTHVLEIEWDIKHSGAHAIDYITHYDRISEDVQPCRGISGCNGAVFNTFPIPAPSSNGSPMAGQPTASFNALPPAQRVMTIYNGTITAVTYVSEGSLTAAQSSTRLQINFTATSPTVVIAWGGHIAAAANWGAGNSASGVSGSPYHTRLISFDGGGGNQDRSLSAAAVLGPGGCTLTGPTTVCESDADPDAHYEVDTPEAGVDYVWSLVDNTSGATITDSNGTAGATIFADVDPGGPGTYTIKATPMNAGGTGTPCVAIVTVEANTSTTDLTDGLSVCAGTSVSYSTTAAGGDGTCSYTWSLDGSAFTDTDGTPGGSHVTIGTTGLSTGSHTVQVSVDCGCGPPAVQSTTFNIKAPTVVTDEIDNAEVCEGATDPVVFQVAATGAGTLSYAWTLDGNPATDADGDDTKLTVNPSALSVGSHPVNVVVTGDCGTDSSSANLVVNSNPTVTVTLSQACDTVTKLTAAAGFDSYSWSGPGFVVDGTGTCGLDKACLLVDKTGVYTVNVEDDNSCSGSQTAQLCFTMTSPAPASAQASVTAPGPETTLPAQKPIARESLLAKIAKVVFWPFN